MKSISTASILLLKRMQQLARRLLGSLNKRTFQRVQYRSPSRLLALLSIGYLTVIQASSIGHECPRNHQALTILDTVQKNFSILTSRLLYFLYSSLCTHIVSRQNIDCGGRGLAGDRREKSRPRFSREWPSTHCNPRAKQKRFIFFFIIAV